MDFGAIASQAIAILIPILTAAKEGAVNGIKNDVWEFIKNAFKRKKDDEKIANDLEKNPDDGKLQGKAELRLAQLLEENPDLAEQLQEYINKEKTKADESINVQVSGNGITTIIKDSQVQGPVIGKVDNLTINNAAAEQPKKS